MKKEISSSVVDKTKNWLGEDGIKCFKEIKTKHGQIDICWHEGLDPHPVHFREGMQVINFLRTLAECKDWTDHDFDDNWVEVVEKTIE